MESESAVMLAGARAGDEAARESLFYRYAGKLRFFLRARTGRALAARVDIEDLVQETFLRAFRDMSRFEGSSGTDWYHWLIPIARHVLADAGRAARAGKRAVSGERPLARSDWSRVGAATWGPATRVQFTEEQHRLEEAFDRLSPSQRRIIRMRQFEGLSARDAAKAIGTSEGAVHALYRRALQAWAAEARIGP